MLLVHLAIRRLRDQAALDPALDPDRLSFLRSVRIVRRQVTTTGQLALPPEPEARTLARLPREIAERPLPEPRLRAFPGVIKHKLSNFGVKRAHHRYWPRPTVPPAEAVVIVAASRPTPIRRLRRTTASQPSSPTEPAESTEAIGIAAKQPI